MGERSDDDRRFPEPPDGLLTHPENHLLAFLEPPRDVAAAMLDLAENGFPRDEVFVLCGPKGAGHGVPGRTYRVMEWMGDQRDVLLGSGEHLGVGRPVVTVNPDDAKAAAALVVATHGGAETAHFGMGHREPIGP